jgi:putative endonuclease
MCEQQNWHSFFMQKFYTYIIQSLIDNSLYKGHSMNIENRLSQHNAGKTKSIKSKIPFKLIYFEEFNSRKEAIDRERYFKSAAGRRWINKNIINSDMLGSTPERLT